MIPHFPVHIRGLRWRGMAAFIVLIALCTVAADWRSSPSSPPAPARHSGGSGDARSYTVRGQIEELPLPGKPMTALQIHHESIADFADRDGAAVGMSSMTMDFPTADGVSLAGLAIGDKVEFVLEVNWGGFPIYQITRIAKLPAETLLSFDASAPK